MHPILLNTNISVGGLNSVSLATNSGALIFYTTQDGTVQYISKNITNHRGVDMTPPSNLGKCRQIAVGYRSAVALQVDGTVVGWGDDGNTNKNATQYFMTQLNAVGKKVVKLAAGAYHYLALLNDGSVVTWGNSNETAQFSDPNTVWSPVGLIPRPTAAEHPYITGYSAYTNWEYKQDAASFLEFISSSTACVPNPEPIGYRLFRNLATGCPLHNGENYSSGNPNGGYDTPYIRTSGPYAGTYPVRPVRSSSFAWSGILNWVNDTGAPYDYQFSRATVGDPTSVNYSGPGSSWTKSTQAIPMPNGCYNNNCNTPNSIFGTSGKKYIDIAGGRGHSILLTEDGNIETWGQNWYYTITGSGQQGNGWDRPGSGRPNGLNDGTNAGWGAAYPFPPAPIGDQTASTVKSFKTTPGSVKAVGAGYYTSQVIKSDGSVFAWDRNEWGESIPLRNSDGTVGLPTGTFKQITGGYHHTVALRNDGTVVCWGENNSGECNVPFGLKDCVQVIAGARYSAALRNDGVLIFWGKVDDFGINYTPVTNATSFRTTDLVVNINSVNKNLIMLFDSAAGNDYWSIVQGTALGYTANGQIYKLNSAFYPRETAPSGYSADGPNGGWRKTIPTEYKSYISKPKPLSIVNMGHIIYTQQFISEAISQTVKNSVPFPSGYTGGYYYINSQCPGHVALNSVPGGYTASNPVAYTINGSTNYTNFDSTGRGVTISNISGYNILYYLGLTGPLPANAENITAFNSTTSWPTRNAASLIPVHDIVSTLVYIITSVRAFYKNNPEYTQPDFANETKVDHYVAFSFGYSAPRSNVINALDAYVNYAPGVFTTEANGVNNQNVNRYDAITAMNEINRILGYMKSINDNSSRSNEIKTAVLNVIKDQCLTNYKNSDPVSISEYSQMQTILNNVQKLKFSYYFTVSNPYSPVYLNSCSNGNANIFSATGTGATCGTSTLPGSNFYNRTYYYASGITYPFFKNSTSDIYPLYTSVPINLNNTNYFNFTNTPYTIRGICPNFSSYESIMNSKFFRGAALSNNTNGSLKNVDWVYYLAEDSEVHSNDDERAAFNYFSANWTKTVTNFYRGPNVPIISLLQPLTVISSGDLDALASNGFILCPPNSVFKRSVKPVIDAGLDGIGYWANFDDYMRSSLVKLDTMTYAYSNTQTPSLGDGERYSVNSYMAQYFGKYVNVGATYKAPPDSDIKKLTIGVSDVTAAVSSVSGKTYSQLLSHGDTATTNWSNNFASTRGLTYGQYFTSLRGTCFKYTNDPNGKYENYISRRSEVQKIIDINSDWGKAYLESALLYKYGATYYSDDASLPAPTSSTDYEVFATDWGTDPLTNYGWGGSGYTLYSMVPSIDISSSVYNGLRPAGETNGQSFNVASFKTKITPVPPSRRVANLNMWWDDLAVMSYDKRNSYINTADGISYSGSTFLTPWASVNAADYKSSMISVLNKCKDENIVIPYFTDNKGLEYIGQLYGLQGSFSYWDGGNSFGPSGNPLHPIRKMGPLPQFQNVYPDARYFAAWINDPRFNSYIMNTSGKSVAKSMVDYYNLLTGGSTTASAETLYSKAKGVTLFNDFTYYGGYFEHPYSYYGTGAPTTAAQRQDESYKALAWQAAFDELTNGNYIISTKNQVKNAVSYYANSLFSSYEVYPVDGVETQYYQDSNDQLQIKPNYPYVSGGKGFYGWQGNIIYPLNSGFPSSTPPNYVSGYVLNPQTDKEKYNWQGHQNPSYVPTTGSTLIRYASTPAINYSEWKSQVVYKQFVNDIKVIRLQYRTKPDFYNYHTPFVATKYDIPDYGTAPGITGPVCLYNSFYDDSRYFREFMYHTLLHGVLYVMNYLADKATLNEILNTWRTISNNSNSVPCSNSTGDINLPVDRLVLSDAITKMVMSGGRLTKSGKYLWRITLPPTAKRSDNTILLKRVNNLDTDLPEYITIDCSDPKNGYGTWIKRTVSSPPYYTVI